MRSTQMNKQVRAFIQYDAHEISMVRSKEFPGTELWQNTARTFWNEIQPRSPAGGPQRERGFRSIPPDVETGYPFWKRRRDDEEEVRSLKDFVLNNKVYNFNNPNKRLRRTLVNTNGPLNTMVPPKFPDKHLDPENAGKELCAYVDRILTRVQDNHLQHSLMTSAGNWTI